MGYMNIKDRPHKYKVIDLFSGCGGMSWGLHKAGFEVIAGIDNWQIALDTFKHNHPDALAINGDISKLNPEVIMQELGLGVGGLDCLIGGPPCQGFSKNVVAASRFLDDPRNQLFRDYIRFVKALMPKVIIMENVAEIYNAYRGTVREEIIQMLKELGYKVEVNVLYAPDFGVPQRRRRCFFFATKTGKAPVFPQPSFGKKDELTVFGEVNKYRSAWSAISDLPTIENGEGKDELEYDKSAENDYQTQMRRGSVKVSNHISNKLRETQYQRVQSLKPGEDIRHLPVHLKPRSGFSGAYGRLDYEMIAPTITRWVFHIGSGRYSHPREDRAITMREAARLQSFSDDFIFLGSRNDQAGQIGNAVPPLFMDALAPQITACLDVVQKAKQLPTQEVALARA